MGSIKKLVEKEVPGVYVRSLEIGDSIAAVCSREKMVVRGLGKLSAQLGIYPIRFLSIAFFSTLQVGYIYSWEECSTAW